MDFRVYKSKKFYVSLSGILVEPIPEAYSVCKTVSVKFYIRRDCQYNSTSLRNRNIDHPDEVESFNGGGLQ